MRLHLYYWALATLLATSGAAIGTAQNPESQPTTSNTPRAQEVLDAALSALADAASPDAQREVLLGLLGDEPTRAHQDAVLAGLLMSGDEASQIAAADVLHEQPGRLSPALLEPLASLLPLSENARRAAATALAGWPDDGGVAPLREFAADAGQPVASRAQVLGLLGAFGDRAATAVLVDALDVPDPTLASAALAAFEDTTGMQFADNPAAARRWWTESQVDLPLSEWRRLRVQRLLQCGRQQAQYVDQLETRLIRLLRTAFQRTPPDQRGELLAGLLADPLEAVQLLGLELVQGELAEGREVAAAVHQAARERLSAPSADVRAAAVRTMTSLRDPDAAAAFLVALEREERPPVQAALVSGLGYLGGEAAVDALLVRLDVSTPRMRGEVLTALGRMAERDTLGGKRPAVIAALTQLCGTVDAPGSGPRERVIWAMSRVADPTFAPLLAAALTPEEAPGVRSAALRGLAIINDPNDADALMPLVADADAGLRREAVELLARWASTDEHLDILFRRLAADSEPDEAVRASAWKGALRLLAARTPDEIEHWLGRLSDTGDTDDGQRLALLDLKLARLDADAHAAARGDVQARRAAILASLGRPDEALAAYAAAVPLLHHASAPSLMPIIGQYISLALVQQRYDDSLVQSLRGLNPPIDVEAIWTTVGAGIDRRLADHAFDAALLMMEQLRQRPLGEAWPAGVQAALSATELRALRMATDAELASVDAALETFATDPENSAAAETLARLRPVLCDRLRALLMLDPGDAERVRAVHDALRSVAPGWSGFTVDAPRDDQLKAINELDAKQPG